MAKLKLGKETREIALNEQDRIVTDETKAKQRFILLTPDPVFHASFGSALRDAIRIYESSSYECAIVNVYAEKGHPLTYDFEGNPTSLKL